MRILYISSALFFLQITSFSQTACIDKILKEARLLENNSRQLSTGTGFLLNNDGVILTNKHVVAGANEKIMVSFIVNDKAITREAKFIVGSIKNDLAKIKCDLTGLGITSVFPYGVNFREPILGEEIFILGYPLPGIMGQSIKLTTGTVSSTNGIFDDKTQFQISAPIQPGNSGSPIIDKYGNVIGIAVSSLKTGQNVNYGLKAKLLGDFPIDKVTSKKNKMPPFNSLQKYICLISVETDRTYFPGLKYSKGNFDVFPTSSFKSEVSKENPCSNTSLDQLFSKEYEIYDGIKVEPKMKAILDDKYANAIYQTYKLNNSWDNYDSYLKLFALLGIGAYENIVEDVEDLNPDLLTKEEKRNYLESNFIPYSIAKLQVLKNAPVESSIQSLIKKTNDAIEISTDYRKLNPNTKEDIDNDKKLFGAYYRILAHLYLIIDDKTNVQLNYNNATKYVASNINDVNDQEIISYLKLKNK